MPARTNRANSISLPPVQLDNGLFLSGYCHECSVSCQLALNGEDLAKDEGDVRYTARCDVHPTIQDEDTGEASGNDEEGILDDHVAKEARRRAYRRRDITVSCFELL